MTVSSILHNGRSLFGRWFLFFMFTLVACLGAVTFYFFLNLDPGQDTKLLDTILLVDTVLLVTIAGGLIVRMIQLWLRFRKKVSGTKLHFRIMLLFSIVAIIPAVIMIAFSTVFFHYGVQSWFNNRVQGALDQSLQVARSYLKEHEQIMERDALILAKDISNNPDFLDFPKAQRDRQFTFMASAIRGMKEAIVFDQKVNIIARSDLTFAIGFEYIPAQVFDQIRQAPPESKALLLRSDKNDRLRALVKINTKVPTYLYVGRFVDPKVLEFVHKAENNVVDYGRLKVFRHQFEMTFTLVFIVVSLLVVFTAMLFGLRFADRLLHPLEELSDAAKKMAAGDLSARVGENQKHDEINALKRTFNKMANQLDHQRQDLLKVNEALLDHRHFMESVLANISSAVINVDASGNILFVNASAKKIFNKDFSQSLGQQLDKVLPFFKGVLFQEQKEFDSLQRKVLIEGNEHILSIKILRDTDPGAAVGYFITVEDVTELLSVQKKAAWADVARQIAHEIKNPLTPIQLATERLKKKFIGQIDTGKEQFSDYIETIMRYVQQIQSLINAFSDFARMPTPKLDRVDLVSLVSKALSLQKVAYPSIQFIDQVKGQPPATLLLDANLITQALTNLLKNAIEAIKDIENPQILVTLERGEKECVLQILDNGPGFPDTLKMDDLFDPYVTFSKEGTGLGLGIVKNIIENHGGTVALRSNEPTGAIVDIRLPVPEDAKGEEKKS